MLYFYPSIITRIDNKQLQPKKQIKYRYFLVNLLPFRIVLELIMQKLKDNQTLTYLPKYHLEVIFVNNYYLLTRFLH